MSKDQKITIEELTEALKRAEAKSAEHLAGWQRARADYSNFKKEQERRQAEIIQFANAAFMAEVLPIYSHFKLALAHFPEEERKSDWLVGLLQIQKQFQEFLKKYQIEEIKTVGEQFDHHQHEAVSHEQKEGFEEDTIFEEVQPGYRLDGKVLLPAKVRVAR